MKALGFPLLLVSLALTSFASTAGVVYTSSNLVPQSSVADVSQAQGVNDFKPDECTGVLDGVVAGSGNFNATKDADLVLGSAGADTIHAGNGDDCVLGGGGNDTIDGQNGQDILLGGPDTDVCDGGPQADAFPDGTCETANQ